MRMYVTTEINRKFHKPRILCSTVEFYMTPSETDSFYPLLIYSCKKWKFFEQDALNLFQSKAKSFLTCVVNQYRSLNAKLKVHNSQSRFQTCHRTLTLFSIKTVREHR